MRTARRANGNLGVENMFTAYFRSNEAFTQLYYLPHNESAYLNAGLGRNGNSIKHNIDISNAEGSKILTCFSQSTRQTRAAESKPYT